MSLNEKLACKKVLHDIHKTESKMEQFQLRSGDADKMKDKNKEVREMLANKNSVVPGEITITINDLQQQSPVGQANPAA